MNVFKTVNNPFYNISRYDLKSRDLTASRLTIYKKNTTLSNTCHQYKEYCWVLNGTQ